MAPRATNATVVATINTSRLLTASSSFPACSLCLESTIAEEVSQNDEGMPPFWSGNCVGVSPYSVVQRVRALRKTSYQPLMRNAVDRFWKMPTCWIAALSILSPQPRLAGPDDGVSPVGDLQFGEDVGDVVAYGLGAEVEAGGDLGVGVALGDEVEDLDLTGSQLGQGLGGSCRPG